jgi:hypothetical protein
MFALPLACFEPVQAPLAVQEVTLLEDQVSTAVSPSVVLVGLTAIVTLGEPVPLLLLLALLPLLLLLLVLMALLVSLLPPQPDPTAANRATIAQKTCWRRKNAPGAGFAPGSDSKVVMPFTIQPLAINTPWPTRRASRGASMHHYRTMLLLSVSVGRQRHAVRVPSP